MVLFVIDGVHHHNVLSPPMYALISSMAGAAAWCTPVGPRIEACSSIQMPSLHGPQLGHMVLVVVDCVIHRHVLVCRCAVFTHWRVHTFHSAQVHSLEATLHRDSIPRVIVDSGRRVLVLVASMSIDGVGDGRNLIGDGDFAAADRHDDGHEPTSAS